MSRKRGSLTIGWAKAHKPPWIANDEMISTRMLINAHRNGIIVDILNDPAS